MIAKAIKEFFISVKIINSLTKELILECKLAEHRCRMINIYKEYEEYNFLSNYVKEEFDRLHRRLLEAKKEYNKREGEGHECRT